jgi:hypothetical protein
LGSRHHVVVPGGAMQKNSAVRRPERKPAVRPAGNDLPLSSSPIDCRCCHVSPLPMPHAGAHLGTGSRVTRYCRAHPSDGDVWYRCLYCDVEQFRNNSYAASPSSPGQFPPAGSSRCRAGPRGFDCWQCGRMAKSGQATGSVRVTPDRDWRIATANIKRPQVVQTQEVVHGIGVETADGEFVTLMRPSGVWQIHLALHAGTQVNWTGGHSFRPAFRSKAPSSLDHCGFRRLSGPNTSPTGLSSDASCSTHSRAACTSPSCA